MSSAKSAISSTQNKSRKVRILQWTRDGEEANETSKWEDQVWWGFWRQVGGEDVNPPDAIFPSEELALAFATVVDLAYDYHVGPVVVDIRARDNFEVPE